MAGKGALQLQRGKVRKRFHQHSRLIPSCGSRALSIQDEQELVSLKAVGRSVRMVLDAMKAEVGPGVTTRYLDQVGARVMQQNGARSAPSVVSQFPGASCISLTTHAVHATPP